MRVAVIEVSVSNRVVFLARGTVTRQFYPRKLFIEAVNKIVGCDEVVPLKNTLLGLGNKIPTLRPMESYVCLKTPEGFTIEIFTMSPVVNGGTS